MNLFFKFLFILLFTNISYANSTFTKLIKLPKNYKVKNTFSGDFSDNDSFHLVFSKNKENKKHSVHTFFFNGKNIDRLKPFEYEEEYSVVSFHKNNNIISLLLTYKTKKESYLKRVDIDIISKEITHNKPILHKDYFTSIRTKDRSILIYKNKSEISIIEFTGTNEAKKNTIKFNQRNKEYLYFFSPDYIDAIKTDEFIANGSVSDLRVYLDNSNLIFTKDNGNKNYTKLINVSLKPNNFKYSPIYKFTTKEKLYKKFTSFYHNNKIYQFLNDKKQGVINILTIKNDSIKTFFLNNLLSSKIRSNKSFLGIENFLKQAGKNKYNTTITINPTLDDNIKLRVDYVNINYSYHYNWWWHHQQFLMMNHQNMINNIKINTPTHFGPSPNNDIHFNTYLIKKEKRYFELLLNNKGEILNKELAETVYKEIDKKKFIKKLENIEDIKHESSCFLKNSYRYIGYSNKLKGFIFQTKKI